MRYRFLLFFLITFSCNKQQRDQSHVYKKFTHDPDPSAVKFNNKAVRLFGKVSVHNDDFMNSLLYDSALIYLNKAIEIDSVYLMAYTNKAQTLKRKGLFKQSLAVLVKVEKIKPDFVEVIMGQGFILEKIGDIDLAIKKYKQALEVYKNRLDDKTKRVKTQSDIAFLYLFLEDKNKAVDEIQNLILENPDNDQLKAMERYIKDFNRKKFITEY